MIADEYGAAIGYAKGTLNEQIAGVWSEQLMPGHDYDVLTGDELREFKAVLEVSETVSETYKFVPSLTILYETGADGVTMLTNKPAGKALRRVLVEHVIPKLRRGEAVSLKPRPSDQKLLETLERMEGALTEGRTRQEKLEGELADLAKLMSQYTSHPDRFMNFQRLGDNDGTSADLCGLMIGAAAHHRVSWYRIHGIILRTFKVNSYKMLGHTQQAEADKQLRALLLRRVGDLPAKARKSQRTAMVPSMPGQMKLFPKPN